MAINDAKHKNAMDALSAKLDICAPLLKGRVIFIEYPVHGNVGDTLIWWGTEKFFERNKINITDRFSLRLGWRAHKALSKCDTVCFQGGGNFGDLYTFGQRIRKEIAQRYPDKRIVILPQSVHFQNQENLVEDCKILRKHPDLHIFLRDKQSYAILEEQSLPNLYLCPDMAHALWGHIKPTQEPEKEKLFLLRRDKEKSFLPEDLKSMENTAFDWPDLLKDPLMFLLYQLGFQTDRIDGRILGNMLPALAIWNLAANRMVTMSLKMFSKHRIIVSNRMHAMIFSTLLEKEAIIYDNSYRKLSTYAELWLSDVEGITFENHN